LAVSLENEIDKLVYELYNLTEDEIAIVEGALWIADWRGGHGLRGIKRFFVTFPSLAKGNVRDTITFSASSVFSVPSAIQTTKVIRVIQKPRQHTILSTW